MPWWRFLFVLVLAAFAASTWIVAGQQTARGGHTLDNGHCETSPVLCVRDYSAAGDNLIAIQRSFAIKNTNILYDGWPSSYNSAKLHAEIVWSKAVGPQAPSANPNHPQLPLAMTNYYLKCPEQGDPGNDCSIISPTIAYVYLRDIDFVLQCSEGRYNIRGASTYIHTAAFGGLPENSRKAALAHEFGHVIGLADNTQTGCIMFGFVSVPNDPCDIGTANPYTKDPPPCGTDDEKWGVRCIFKWWREQPLPAMGILTNCGDLNRDNTVNIGDDILGAAAAFGPAGSNEYHPDADIDLNGTVNLVNDILGIAAQFGDACTPAFGHYNHS